MPRLRWPDSTNPVSEEPGTVHLVPSRTEEWASDPHTHPGSTSPVDRSVSNSLSDRHWELDQVPAVGDPTDIVQFGMGHHVSANEGRRRVALQRRVAAHLVVVGQTLGATQRCPNPGFSERIRNSRRTGEQPQSQGGLDGEIRVAPLPTPPTAPAGRPGSDRLRGQPHRHIAAANEGLVIGRPVRNAVLRLIRGMNLRLHSRSVAPAEGPEKCEPRRPTGRGYSCNNAGWRPRAFSSPTPKYFLDTANPGSD